MASLATVAAASHVGTGVDAHWIALAPQPDEALAWVHWALRFTPRVAQLEEAVLLEVQSNLRLWGGRRALLRQLLSGGEALAPAPWASGGTALLALARLRVQVQALEGLAGSGGLSAAASKQPPHTLPVHTLSALRPHAAALARMGCRTWGDVRALPRAGLVRRLGAPALAALDQALGHAPHTLPWLSLPPTFDAALDTPATVHHAAELLWTAQRLLGQLSVWLQARQLGVLALRLQWTHHLRRLDGIDIPPTGHTDLRTAQPLQQLAHLKRLLAQRLERTTLAAPVDRLRLQSLQTAPWQPRNRSWLPAGDGSDLDTQEGEGLSQLVERLSERLGPQAVRYAVPTDDHRPEALQHWQPTALHTPALQALQHSGVQPGLTHCAAAEDRFAGDIDPTAAHVTFAHTTPAVAQRPPGAPSHPAWLFNPPQPMNPGAVPLALMSPHPQQRLETHWWLPGGPVRRDYWLARHPRWGVVWVYRDAAIAAPGAAPPGGWWLHGVMD
jgi:protein ImuB